MTFFPLSSKVPHAPYFLFSQAHFPENFAYPLAYAKHGILYLEHSQTRAMKKRLSFKRRHCVKEKKFLAALVWSELSPIALQISLSNAWAGGTIARLEWRGAAHAVRQQPYHSLGLGIAAASILAIQNSITIPAEQRLIRRHLTLS